MKNNTNQSPANRRSGAAMRGGNPLARALQEAEKGRGQKAGADNDPNSLFSQALSQSGGKLNSPDQLDREALEKQQAEQLEKQKKEAQRKKRHDQINPVDMVDVFSARETRVKEEIDKLRQELKALAGEVTKFHKEIDLTLHQDVVNPGQDGTYYLNFFQKLRRFILLLRQKIKSARTWARQMQAKKKKKKRRSKFGAGIDVAGQSHEQGKAVHDMMHHENNMVYGG